MVIINLLFVVGSTDGAVHVWNSETYLREAVLHCGYTNPVHCVQFNPKYMMIVTASTQMVCCLFPFFLDFSEMLFNIQIFLSVVYF